jgi:ribosomal protein S18 acetylase RimI-like enzyme
MTANTFTTIELKDGVKPEIDGLEFRGFQGNSDYPSMLNVLKVCIEADQMEEEYTLEDLTREYENIQRCSLPTDMIFAEINGEVIAFGACRWDQEISNDFTYRSFVSLIPEWRGKGIGLAMAKHLHARIREIARQHPQEAAKFFQMHAADTQTWQTGLITKLGLEPVRYAILMTRPCSLLVEVTPLPEGIEVRPTKTGDLRKIWNSAYEAFHDHFGARQLTEQDYQNWTMDPEFQPQLWKIAWQGEEPVGNVLNFILHAENEKYNRKRGYTEGISVRVPWRRQGIARSLLTQSIKMFQDMGMEETCLGVDTVNPRGALKFYESLGYKEIKRYVTYRKQFD